ncbi:hypothetical protein CAEBREN_08505 [Caenorhabditis brenneri]|uniref:Uncharacterized protein n=1 Tax=Caenorhabditis brenneri TaxID=135651 RepID=G0MSQ0_CAEBE|nr:hypothetical protein CAEBREN_08505 [Caenorhabditis brenneri]
MEPSHISPYLRTIKWEPLNDAEGEDSGIEGPFTFDRQFKVTLEMVPTHNFVSFKYWDWNYAYNVVTQSLVTRTRLASDLPEDFLPVPYYAAWIKYLKGYKDRSFPSNSLYLREYMVRHKQAFEDIMDGFKPEHELKASKKLRKMTKKRLFGLFNGSLEQSWDRTNDDNEDETFKQNLEKRRCWSKYIMVWNAFMVDAVIYIDVVQNMPENALPRSLELRIDAYSDLDESQIDLFYSELQSFKICMSLPFINRPTSSVPDVPDEVANEDAESAKLLQMCTAFVEVMKQSFTQITTFVKHCYDPSNVALIEYSRQLNRDKAMNRNVLDVSDDTVDGLNSVPASDEGMIDVGRLNVENSSAVPVANVSNGQGMDVTPVATINVSDEPLVPNNSVLPVAGIPSLLSLNLPGPNPSAGFGATYHSPYDQHNLPPFFHQSFANHPSPEAGSPINLTGVSNFISSGLQPNPASGLPPPPLMELPIQPPPGFPNNHLPPRMFSANTPHPRPVTPFLSPNQSPSGYPNNYLPPFMRADTPFQQFRSNTPYARPDTPFLLPNHLPPGAQMQWHNPQLPANSPHLAANIHRPDTPFLHPGFQNGRFPPPYHPYMRPQTPFMQPDPNALHHGFARPTHRASRRGRRQ